MPLPIGREREKQQLKVNGVKSRLVRSSVLIRLTTKMTKAKVWIGLRGTRKRPRYTKPKKKTIYPGPRRGVHGSYFSLQRAYGRGGVKNNDPFYSYRDTYYELD